MRRLSLLLLILIAVFAAGCGKDTPVEPTKTGPDIPTVDTTELQRLEKLATQPDGGVAALSQGLHIVSVPSGSHDALAGAIATAGNGGVVILRKGPHTESGMVTVSTRVAILGERGAELISSAGAPSPVYPLPVAPALWIRADGVSVSGVKFSSAPGDGNTAVLIQNADNVLVFNNTMTGFQFGILVEHGDYAKLWSNTVVGSSAWLEGTVGDTEDIIVINGSYASVLKNEVSNGVFGIWPCGSNGVLAYNKGYGNYVGIIFCKVPEGSFALPDGTVSGSELSSNYWFATENVTTDNFTVGFLSIDGANHNLMVSNASSGNGTYDVELAGDSYRFGFLTPTCHDETFIAGRYAGIEVKDCGANNSVSGASLVDNTLEPCD